MKKTKDIIVIGLALFAMFFGAGNLIFPPKLGADLGHNWITGVLGFSLSDAGISFLAVVAIAVAGGQIEGIGKKVHPKLGVIIGVMSSLILGPLLSVPRTGAVAYEMGIKPLFPDISLFWFTLIYFGITFLIVNNPNNVVDKIGKFLTPALLIGLAVIVIKGILYPSSAPVAPVIHEEFGTAFKEGYQTVDGLCALLLTGFIITFLKGKGYTNKKEILNMTIKGAVLASVLVTVIYASLMYLGATNAPILPSDVSRSVLLISIVNHLMGPIGMTFMAIAVLMACFTTAAGLTATIGKIFESNFKNRVKYKYIASSILLISWGLSNMGVEMIIKVAEPALKIIYPAVVVMILMKLMERFFQSKLSWRVAFVVCIFMSIPGFCISSGIHFPFPTPSSMEFPMVRWEMEWLIPSLFAATITELAVRFARVYCFKRSLKSA